MKTTLKFAAIAMMFCSSMLYGQNDTTGWGRNSQFNRMYDPTAVTEFTGEIVKIETISPMRGMSMGIHMTIRSQDQTYSVHLGPKWYLDNQSMKLSKKDNVKVKGSKVTFDNAPAIIAMEITKGTEVLKLRNQNGIPVWSGGRRR